MSQGGHGDPAGTGTAVKEGTYRVHQATPPPPARGLVAVVVILVLFDVGEIHVREGMPPVAAAQVAAAFLRTGGLLVLGVGLVGAELDPLGRPPRDRPRLWSGGGGGVGGSPGISSSFSSWKQGCQMAKFDPFLSLDCARVEGVGAQSKERKGSNFAA